MRVATGINQLCQLPCGASFRTLKLKLSASGVRVAQMKSVLLFSIMTIMAPLHNCSGGRRKSSDPLSVPEIDGSASIAVMALCVAVGLLLYHRNK